MEQKCSISIDKHNFCTSSNSLHLNEKTKENFLKIGSKVPFAGIYCTILAGVSFTLSKLMVKLVPSIHPVEFVMIRGFFTLLFYVPFVIRKRISFFGENQTQLVFLCLRGMLGLIICTTSYVALWWIPLADSITILLSATVYTSFFAKFILGENFSLLNFILILLTMAGIILIAKPPFLFEIQQIEYNLNRTFAMILTLIAAFSFSLSYCVMRKLKGVHVDLIISYFGLFTFIGSAITLVILKLSLNDDKIKIPIGYLEWICILSVCVFGIIGEFFLTTALQLEKAYIVSITRGGDIIIAFLFQVFLLHNEVIEWTSILGSVIILFGIISTALIKYFQERDPKIPE